MVSGEDSMAGWRSSIYIYIGSGIFYPQGVSISAPSAALDIICCNSAKGIIDLSVGSGHWSHHLAAAAAAVFLQIDTHTHTPPPSLI